MKAQPIFIARSARVALLLIVTALMAGCASGGLWSSKTPEEIVAKRAQSWMDALLEGDVDKAYRYTSPNYRKFATSALYNARVAGISRWESAIVDSVTCELERCLVVFMAEYEIPTQKLKIRRPREYRWTLVDDTWWLYVAPR